MTVTLSEAGTIRLHGECGIDDAEALLRLLIANPGASVDWRECERAHAAIVQLQMAAVQHGGRNWIGPPRDAWLGALAANSEEP